MTRDPMTVKRVHVAGRAPDELHRLPRVDVGAVGLRPGAVLDEPTDNGFMYLMLKQVDHPKRIVPDRTVCSGLWNVYCCVSDADAL